MNLLAQTSSPMLAPSGESLSFFLDMEIKVGDKVRMSKDAPKLLFTRSICNYPEYVFEVRVIEDDLADIYYGAGKIPLAAFVVPTKYLIKVEDEAKEPKFKVGDVIDTPKGKGTVRISYGDYWVVQLDNGVWYIHTETNMPSAPYTKPKEQTETEKKPNIGSIKIPVEVDLTDSYWTAYTADNAKEIALKVANKYNDPKEAADYAVSVAKAVVENLNKK